MSQNASLPKSRLNTENALYFCLLYLGFRPGLFNMRFYKFNYLLKLKVTGLIGDWHDGHPTIYLQGS